MTGLDPVIHAGWLPPGIVRLRIERLDAPVKALNGDPRRAGTSNGRTRPLESEH